MKLNKERRGFVMRLKKLKQSGKKILSCTLAIALMVTSFAGVSSPITVNAKFPSDKTNKSATLTHSSHVFVSDLSNRKSVV